ncbi:MAG: PQQ-binding-like beta-propeller repeat protein [Bacteroidia bacterium]|jgi:outer membrane protein assembly factor BamB|nr:PQQ-binding-like beta-propeller repeat protein [Bacteroidia bacterium]
MRYALFLILIIACSSLSTCKKEPPQEVPLPSTASALELVWQVPSPYYSVPPMLNSNGDVLMSATFIDPTKGEVFKLLDQASGQLKWQWNDYFRPKEGFAKDLMVQRNDILVLSDRNYNYALNMLTGQTIWRNQIDTMEAEPQIYEDEDGYVYKGFRSRTLQSTVYIMRAMYNLGNWELVCTYQDPNPIPGRFEVASIGVTNNTKGEKVVAFTVYTYPQNSTDTAKALIIGYNTITKNFDWVKNYNDFIVEFSIYMFTDYKSVVYSFGYYGSNGYLIATSVDNGNVLWKHRLSDRGTNVNFYKDNIVVTCSNESPVLCLNKLTGALIWNQSFSTITQDQRRGLNFQDGECTVYKNYHLSTQCNYLLALNLDNGSIAYFEKAALPEGCLQSGIVVDEQKKVFYTEDRLRLLCYKLPEVLK